MSEPEGRTPQQWAALAADRLTLITQLQAELGAQEVQLRVAQKKAAQAEKETPPAAAPAQKKKSPQPIPGDPGSVSVWVATWLAERTRSRGRWCDQWEDHPDALTRLDALYGAWKGAKADPDNYAAMSRWLLEHHDRHMAVLLGPTSPFSQCRPEDHSLPDQLFTGPTAQGHSQPERGVQTRTGDVIK